ncbi:ankyrin repeat-containing protein BDA1-like isoform X2 [Tripterygium wilfordii]|uniref:ankyrin repeat-containing protein BDA1-like isoform X2 n=1 Tax=Tripterygium wilfordii TaxID=458696 RepID=UPI0018F7EA33|nr:ankyrin repeat-containing protein BDA1-like isoform X2 [Tripterygium wilfordii]
MAQTLEAAARAGNIDALYESIREDAYLLDKIDKVPFVDTPLHIAASAGHTEFALEMMRLKPSFSRKLNQYGFSPIHLGLQNEHYELVIHLIEVDKDLVRVQRRGGITPLHYAAENGLLDLLFKFLMTCPASIEDVTIQKETALHLAVKNNMLEAVKLLLGWLSYVNKKMIAEWPDIEGNTILHIAASYGNIQLVRLLINKVDTRSKNSAGLTPGDILKGRNPNEEELKDLLHSAGDSGAFWPLYFLTLYVNRLISRIMKWVLRMRYKKPAKLSNEQRSATLVVAVLVATATYQAMLTPPARDWFKDDNKAAKSTMEQQIAPAPFVPSIDVNRKLIRVQGRGGVTLYRRVERFCRSYKPRKQISLCISVTIVHTLFSIHITTFPPQN